MRRAAGCTSHLARCLTLLAAAACSATRAPAVQLVRHEPCELREIGERTADGAVLAVRTPAVAPTDCVLPLVAAALRPWLDGVVEPWTVTVVTAAPSDTGNVTVIVRRLRTTQARDALDGDSAVLATEDLDLVEYARARDDLVVVALPWDLVYVGVGTAFDDSSGAVDPAAVGAVARLAAPLPQCEPLSPAPPAGERTRSGRAVYLRGDRTGRELAERVVGLGHAREVVGLDSAAFDAALSTGDDAAYIVSLVLTGDGCDALEGLRRRAPWADRASIAPLIETRAHAIMRRGSGP
jgi:hypothetical protein